MFAFLKQYGRITALLFTVCLVLTACGTSIDQEKRSSVLVVGLEDSYPPFEYIDDQGQLVGFDLDIAQQLGTFLGRKVIIKSMEFENLVPSLKNGEIDLIISGLTITPERLNDLQMVAYHGDDSTEFSLIFWELIPEGVQSLDDIASLSNPTISVESGATAEQYLSHFPEIQVLAQQGSLQPLIDLKSGAAAASLVDADVAAYLKKRYPEIQVISVPVSDEGYMLGCGIGIKMEDEKLGRQVLEAVHSLKTSGELKKLEQKWFQAE